MYITKELYRYRDIGVSRDSTYLMASHTRTHPDRQYLKLQDGKPSQMIPSETRGLPNSGTRPT